MTEKKGEFGAVLGEALELIPTLEENSIHAVITDPPY